MSTHDDEQNNTDHDLEERPAKLQKTQDNQFDRTIEPSESAASPTIPAEVAASTNPPSQLTGPDGQPISKSQLKKLRKKAEWAAQRPQWKALQKEKRHARQERKKLAKQQQQQVSPETASSSRPNNARPNRTYKPKAVQLPLTIILDCDFDSYMNERERISLASQITRCYSDNGKARFRAHLAVASFGGSLRERFETVLTGFRAWKGVRFFPGKDDGEGEGAGGEGGNGDFVDVAKKAQGWMSDEGERNVLKGAFEGVLRVEGEGGGEDEGKTQEELLAAGEVIYLSSESDNVLTELRPYSTYIIGGLVDKNREKGLCHRRATERGIQTAKLPIGEFMEMTSRKVLATNHVVEIMLRWLETRDWAEAFEAVIPKRKGGVLRGENEGGGEGGEEDDEEDGDDEAQDEEDAQDDVDGEMEDQDAEGGIDLPSGKDDVGGVKLLAEEAGPDRPSNGDESTSTAPTTIPS